MGEERGRTASTTEPRALGAPELRVEREATAHITPAKGSGQIHRDAFREGTDEMATREMDPGQFRSLLAQESARTRALRTPTIPATNEVMQDLVARSAAHDALAPDDDLAIAVEARKPVVDDVHQPYEPLDLPELDPRRETRHAAAIAPLAKPRLPTAPASSNRLTALLVLLVLAIGGAVAYYVLTGRV